MKGNLITQRVHEKEGFFFNSGVGRGNEDPTPQRGGWFHGRGKRLVGLLHSSKVREGFLINILRKSGVETRGVSAWWKNRVFFGGSGKPEGKNQVIGRESFLKAIVLPLPVHCKLRDYS